MRFLIAYRVQFGNVLIQSKLSILSRIKDRQDLHQQRDQNIILIIRAWGDCCTQKRIQNGQGCSRIRRNKSSVSQEFQGLGMAIFVQYHLRDRDLSWIIEKGKKSENRSKYNYSKFLSSENFKIKNFWTKIKFKFFDLENDVLEKNLRHPNSETDQSATEKNWVEKMDQSERRRLKNEKNTPEQNNQRLSRISEAERTCLGTTIEFW